jgi:hypothetical protein
MTLFDPTQFNFVLLRNFELPGRVAVYEYRNHEVVDGSRDFLRLNLYLSKDGDYVTIWHGLLEPIATEAEFRTGRLARLERPADFDFLAAYNQDLFRGYIDSADAALWIFKALRVGTDSAHYALPQLLHAGADSRLRCDVMAKD